MEKRVMVDYDVIHDINVMGHVIDVTRYVEME